MADQSRSSQRILRTVWNRDRCAGDEGSHHSSKYSRTRENKLCTASDNNRCKAEMNLQNMNVAEFNSGISGWS